MEVNPRVVEPGQTTLGPRTFRAFSLVRPTFTVAKSWYDALQASVRMRPTRGLNFLFSYTYGHAEDHVSGLNIGGEERPIVPVDLERMGTIKRSLERERGEALFDVRHRLVLSFGYDLPSLENSSGFARGVFGNWQVNGILQYQTGYPFPIRVRGDDIRGLTSRPDQVCDPNQGASRTVDQWFNTECFVPLTLAETAMRHGNAGRNPIRGPDFERVDLSLIKNVRWAAATVRFNCESKRSTSSTGSTSPSRGTGWETGATAPSRRPTATEGSCSSGSSTTSDQLRGSRPHPEGRGAGDSPALSRSGRPCLGARTRGCGSRRVDRNSGPQ